MIPTERIYQLNVLKKSQKKINPHFFTIQTYKLMSPKSHGKMGGADLELSIVKHIIKGHGGRVWVESKLEEGSAFSFSLPKKQGHNT